MKRPYETMILFDGTLPEETVKSEHQRLEELIKESAELVEVTEWGKRSLAYEIKGKKTGIYYLYHYTAEGDLPGKLDRSIKMNPGILRHLTVVRDPSKRTYADLTEKPVMDDGPSRDEDSADEGRPAASGRGSRYRKEGDDDA